MVKKQQDDEQPSEDVFAFDQTEDEQAQAAGDDEAQQPAASETVEGRPIATEMPTADEVNKQPEVSGDSVPLDTDTKGHVTSTALADALPGLTSATGAPNVDRTAVLTGGNDTSPKQDFTPSGMLSAVGLPATAVVASDGSDLKVYATEQEAFDAGAAIVSRAAPNISPMLGSEPLILKQNSGS